MSGSIAFNPMATTTFNGGFSYQSNGLVQGVAMDDPAVRFALAGGVLAADETTPMWGGVGIYAHVPPAASDTLGTIVGRAANLTPYAAKQMVGFSVVNQATAWLTTPQSPAPTASPGMTVPYFLFGSGARIAVDCDATLAAALLNGTIEPQVYWDFTNQQLVASGTTALPVKVLRVQAGNSKIVVWNGTALTATYNNSGTAALIQI
jgi:hypothetical protein